MNIEHKKTALDDDSVLYQKRDDSLGKKDLSDLNGRQKIGYFKDYYLKAVIVAIIAAAVLASLIYTIFFRHQVTVLSVALMNDVWMERSDDFSQTLRDYYGLTDKNEYIQVDYYNTDDYAAQMKFVTLAGAGEIDVMLSSEDTYLQYAKLGYFEDLSQVLPADVYANWKDRMIETQQEETDDYGKVIQTWPAAPYGIDISGNKRYEEYGGTDTRVILSIMGNTKDNMDHIVMFLKFLEGEQ